MKRAALCDVPGCGNPRRRRQRLCESCFRRLPGAVRSAIIAAKCGRRTADWNRERRHAAQLLGFTTTPAPIAASTAVVASVSPQRAYELQARLLGERSDP